MVAPRQFWNKHAEGYAKKPVPNEAVYQKKLSLTQQLFNKEMSVLEYGCGTGSTAIVHAPFVKQYLGIDVSDKMIEIAEKKRVNAQIDNLTFKVQSIEAFESTEPVFDAVLALSILHLLDEPKANIKQAFKLLKPNGIYVVSAACLSGWFRLFQPLWPIGVALGVLPKIQFGSHKKWLSYMQEAGFVIDTHWIPDQSKHTSFIIARKPA